MARILPLALSLLAATAGAQAQEKFTVQMKWVPQAQFAGYYVAAAKGYYKAEGLDVTIKPGGPDVSPVQVLAGNQADAIVNWMPDALAARDGRVDTASLAADDPLLALVRAVAATAMADLGIEPTLAREIAMALPAPPAPSSSTLAPSGRAPLSTCAFMRVITSVISVVPNKSASIMFLPK